MRGLGRIAALALALASAGPAPAQDFEVDGISAYYCDQLGGEVTGNRQCTAPYRPYDGDACAVHAEYGDQTPEAGDRFDATGESCDPAAVDEAKAATLAKRADLRGYVSLGYDESVNDPVANSSYRPGDATTHPGNYYFAAECAVQRCASGGGAPAGGSSAGSSCPYENDGACDAPGLCPAGTDLADCGGGSSAGGSCRYENDGMCDAPGLCPAGTDLADCGGGSSAGAACRYENDGMCDVPGLCPAGTDVADCFGLQPGPADRGTALEICFRSNRSEKVHLALGRAMDPSSSALTFKGWFTIERGACKRFERFYGGAFLYVAHTIRDGKRQSVWEGDRTACVFRNAFEYVEDLIDFEPCAEEERGFIEKTTDRDSYTLTLNERD